jgi:peptidoglycan/LPS O-acetylase OafA/YrhL
MAGKRVDGIQAGRAIAAVSVVFAHALAYPLPEANAPLISRVLGPFGVTLFFVISGFIMVLVTGRSTFSLSNFLHNRIARVAPMYYFATLLTIASVLLAPALFNNTQVSPIYIIKSFLFIPAARPADGDIVPVLKLGWTLNYEMFFYLSFSLLCFTSAFKRVALLTLIFGSLILLGLTFDFSNTALRFYASHHLLGFVAGLWIGYAHIQRQAPLSQTVKWRWLLLGAGALIWTIGCWLDFSAGMTLVRRCTDVIAATNFVLFASAYAQDLGRTKGARLTLFIGDASYSIYLMHMFAIGAAVAVSRKIFGDDGVVSYVAAVTLGAAGGVVGGCLAYLLVEETLSKLVRKAFPATPTARKIPAQAAP